MRVGLPAPAPAPADIRMRLPFDLQGLHADNGSEFINHHLKQVLA